MPLSLRTLALGALCIALAGCDATQSGESASASAKVSEPMPVDDVDIVVSPSSTPCSGSFYSVDASTTGSRPTGFTWYKNGQPYGSGESGLAEVGTGNDGETITYSVYVSFQSGNTRGNNTTVTLRRCNDVPPPPDDDDDDPTDAEYCAANPSQCYDSNGDGNPDTPWFPPGDRPRDPNYGR